MLYISPKVMNKISVFSREVFCKLNFTRSDSDSRTKLIENLISYWKQPILNYIGQEVHTKKNPGKEKEIIQLLGTKNPNYLNLRDILDIMLDAYSPIDLMLIMTFTNRNRKQIGNKLGSSLDRDIHRGLKLVISEWDNQADNPINNDFLQDFLSTYQFRTKIKKSLSLKDDSLVDDVIKSCIISAKIQQVRRLRRKSNNLLLSDKILEDCYKLWKEILESKNHNKIPSHGVLETKFLDIGISMQFHLNNNRRLEYKSNSPDDSVPKGLELDEFGKAIYDIIRNSKDHIGAQAYYWWFLRIRYMSAKKLIDKRLQKDFLREIDVHKESLNKEMKAYFEEIEDQEYRNLDLIRENDLIHGFQELSNYLSGHYGSENNTDSIQSANEKISNLMSILLGVSKTYLFRI